ETPEGNPWLFVDPKPSLGSLASSSPSVITDERMGGCIFTFDGLTIGLEVCKDHTRPTKFASAGTGRLASYADKIHLHLLPSAGMSIADGLYCKQGGVVFNVDGDGEGYAFVKIKGNTDKMEATKLSEGVSIFGPFRIPRD